MKTWLQASLLCLFAGAFLFSFSETRCAAAGDDQDLLVAKNDAAPPHARAPHDKPGAKRDLPPRDEHGRFVSPGKDKNGRPLPPRDEKGRFVSPDKAKPPRDLPPRDEHGRFVSPGKDKNGRPLPPRDKNGRFVSPDKDKNGRSLPPRDEHGRFLPKDKAPQPAPTRR